MNTIIKIINYFFSFIGFLVSLSFLVLIIAKLALPAWQFDCGVQTSAAFIKKAMKRDAFPIENDSSIFKKLCTHSIFLLKLNKHCDNDFFVDNMLDFRVIFPNYAMLHGQFNEIFVQKIYAFQSKSDTPFIIDAGSNIGISILFFKMMYPNADIIGFEPSAKYFGILEKNIKNNNLSNVQLVNVALSDVQQETTFYDLGSTTGTLIPESEDQDVSIEKVQTDLLSKYINRKIDLLKLDIEGAETKVISELAEKDKLKLIDQLIMEYHYIPGKSKLSVLLDILEQAGFIYEIKNNVTTPFIRKSTQQYFLIHAYRL